MGDAGRGNQERAAFLLAHVLLDILVHVLQEVIQVLPPGAIFLPLVGWSGLKIWDGSHCMKHFN
jgi:hypothetical protein